MQTDVVSFLILFCFQAGLFHRESRDFRLFTIYTVKPVNSQFERLVSKKHLMIFPTEICRVPFTRIHSERLELSRVTAYEVRSR